MWLSVITTFLSFVAGACSGLKVTVPSHTVHGIRGQALYLPVHYGFHTPASDIQIIWLFERPHTMPKYLLGSVNKSVVPDLEYQHKFTMMPPNASLLINPLQFTDEGNYIVKVNIQGNGTLSASQKIQVTVDDPVTKPVVWTQPSSGAVEYVGNMTLTCLVEGGTRLVYQWLKNERPVHTSSTTSFSLQNSTLHIAPVTKEDIGNYSCLVKNPVSEMESDIIMPTIYYGPYGLRVNSDKGLKVGEVFTVDIGEAILFYCSADSYPPNTYSWIRRTDNTTYVIKHGPRLEVASEKVAQKTTDYMCCAYNNVTGRRDEAHFTVIITSVGLEKLAQKGKSLSPLASITGISLFLIISMCLIFLWKKYQPYKGQKQNTGKLKHFQAMKMLWMTSEYMNLLLFQMLLLFPGCQVGLFQPLMVYQDKICTVQFTKSFSTSLPNSMTVQSKYELAFGDAIVEGLSIQPQLSPEFIERLRRKIPKQEIVASVHLKTLPQWKIILGEKIDKHKYLLGSCTWASGLDAELWNLAFTPGESGYERDFQASSQA
ncbi:HEPACAM family member 2 isoform X1 [Enhydra lutris kenyoni]|uniref:HEPACAM family member 2 n=1 Tax=Enhydra lutris kenyoni TaxID=391180 RepID=A0A2Y9JHM7_ENHLU|nr:HEPACAM family member 2 isoform X1 [Enhydra lutris kenyoni]